MPMTKAAAGTIAAPSVWRPRTMAAHAPTAAPAETPTTAGSANGLAKTPCMSAPATPSAAPTTDGGEDLGRAERELADRGREQGHADDERCERRDDRDAASACAGDGG